MRVTMVIPGSGGRYYCPNCVRDNALHARLASAGVDLSVAPMYLPSDLEHDWPGSGGKVFFGAVNAYLQEKIPLFRHTPRWMDAVLDLKPVLEWAGRKAGTTKAKKLGDMTASMLMGAQGRQAKELRRLAAWMRDEARPNVVLLSNALLLGLLPEIKSATGAAIVCNMQDETPWVDAFEPEARERCLRLMSDLAARADALVAPSAYYAGVVSERLRLDRGRIDVIPPGLEFSAYRTAPGPRTGATVGFLSRASPDFGLGELALAVDSLSSEPGLHDLKLAWSGGFAGADDEHLLESARSLLEPSGRLLECEAFDLGSRIEFFGKLSVFCVPARVKEAFGLHALEAMACGIPVVLPSAGGYKEFVEATGGGVLFEPGDAAGMKNALRGFLLDREKGRETGERGRESASSLFSAQRTAASFMEVFERVARGKAGVRA